MEMIFLLDTSNSMNGERINQLNHAMLEVLSGLDYVSQKNNETVNVRVINFNNVARFVVGDAENSVPVFLACESWNNLTSRGATDTAHAIRLCKRAIENDYSNSNYNKTVVMLVTDGQSSDGYDFKDAVLEMKESLSNMQNKQIVFTSVGVCDYDETELNEFASLGNYGGVKSIFNRSVYAIDDINCLTSVIEKALKV